MLWAQQLLEHVQWIETLRNTIQCVKTKKKREVSRVHKEHKEHATRRKAKASEDAEQLTICIRPTGGGRNGLLLGSSRPNPFGLVSTSRLVQI